MLCRLRIFGGLLAAALVISGTDVSAGQITLGTTIRDFNDTHPDFQFNISGLETGIVSSTLGGDGKPVWSGAGGSSVTNETNFNQWYNDVGGVNLSKSHSLTLDETAPGSGIYQFSDSSFFPIDGELFGNQGRSHNYHFTMELHSAFTYTGGETFDFTGDDDVWVFINDELVIDLGGVHGALSDSVSLDSLGLTLGQNYSFDLFFAERHTSASNFLMETTILLQSSPEVPEPGSLAIFGIGMLGVLAGGTRRRRK